MKKLKLMKNKRYPAVSRLLTYFLLIVSSAVFLAGCGGKSSDSVKSAAPAQVINKVSENTLTTIRLSAEAESRLGIETVKVEIKAVPIVLSAGGEVMVPPGQDIIITAPVTGRVSLSSSGAFPVAGASVRKGETLMKLIMLPPELDVISATEAAKVKQAEYNLALAEKERAENLYINKAISGKTLESVKAQLIMAEASLNAAKGKLDMYLGRNPESAAELLSSFAIESPVKGIIQNISVTPGQVITAGASLAEVSSDGKFWVRVHVFSGDLAQVDVQKDAEIIPGSIREMSSHIFAKPIKGPQRSDAASSSSDIYYEFDNSEGLFRTGQKVIMILNLKSSATSLVVPYSSIVYDMAGGTWVYTLKEPQVYLRKRVEISHISGEMAIMTRGVSPGEEVVVSGVAELYGTEFGGGK